jgi:hypothetical protein
MRTDSRYEILDKHECQVKVGPGWVDSIKKNASRTLSHSNVWGYGQNYPIPKEGTKKICAARISTVQTDLTCICTESATSKTSETPCLKYLLSTLIYNRTPDSDKPARARV